MKRRVWKWVLGGIALVALSIGGMLWGAYRRADAVLERHDRRAQADVAAIRARTPIRARLYRPPMSGDGWIDYNKALDALLAIPDSELDEIPAVNAEPGFLPDPEALEDLFEKHEPLVERFRASNRCTGFFPVYRYEDGSSMLLPNASSTLRTARFLSGRATHFADSGRSAGALESILLGLAVAQDTARSGPVINHLVLEACESIEARAVRDLLAESRFTATELEAFARSLDALLEARPDLVDAFAVEDAIAARTLVDLGTRYSTSQAASSLAGIAWGRTWRYLFSCKLTCAGALGEVEPLFARIQSLRGLAPHLRQAAMGRIWSEADSSRNPLVVGWYSGLQRACSRDCVAQLELTLMRVATAIAWYQAEQGVPPGRLEDLVPKHLPRIPDCPLSGKPLLYRDGRVWSVGKNGLDDGGKPGQNDDADATDGDVVWTVKRK